MPQQEKKELKEETPAAATLATHGVDTSRSSVLALIMGQLSGMGVEDLNGFAASLSQIGQEAAPIPGNAAAGNAATIQAKPSFASAMQEDVEELLKGQDLNEEFKEKAKTIFEAAVGARVVLVEAQLQEEYEQKLVEAQEKLTEEIVEKVDSYLDYVVEEFLKENKVEIDHQIRTDVAVSFMEKLKDLFEDHYIDLPDEKVDIANELADHVVDLEDKLNKVMAENIDLKKQSEEVEKTRVVQKLSEGLTVANAARLQTLCEGIEANNLEEFGKKAKVVKEHFMKAPETEATSGDKKKLLTEAEGEGEVVVVEVKDEQVISENVIEDPSIANYAKAISRTSPKKVA